MEFLQYDDDLKEWITFWNQSEQILIVENMLPEYKFQYLIQGTVAGSRMRDFEFTANWR